LGQGRENVKKLLKENKELAAQIEQEIRRKVGLVEPPEEVKAEKKPSS
jgi:recombination protein RecA